MIKWFKSIPRAQWFKAAVVAAAFSVGGYLSKSAVDWWQVKRREHAATIAQLQSLQELLKASQAVFNLQHDQVTNLMALLEQSHPKEYRENEHKGYEETMSRCYTFMNEREKELHGIIRAYSEHSLRKVNQAVSDWLKADTTFKTADVPSARRRQLADELFALEIHLLLWHAKYESWIPNHPEHALVYLADEKQHGLGFPGKRESVEDGVTIKHRGVDVEVAHVLEELRSKWR